MVNYIQIQFYNNMQKPHMTGYDFIVADFRYVQPSLDELCSKLKPDGTLLMANIEENVGAEPVIDQKFVPISTPLKLMSTASIQDSIVAAERDLINIYPDKNELIISKSDENLPDMLAVSHLRQDTKNMHQFAVSHITAWRNSATQGGLPSNPQSPPKSEGSSTGSPKGDLPPPKDFDSYLGLPPEAYYHDAEILGCYERFHFGPGILGQKNFAVAIAEACLAAAKKLKITAGAAIDAGSGPGRSSFELAREFRHVEAFDWSKGMIDLLNSKRSEFLRTKELSDRVVSYTGDCNEIAKICQKDRYNLVLGCNVVDRLKNPAKWVKQAVELMAETDAILVVCSPNSWMTEYTDVENWIGGKYKDGETFTTDDGLKQIVAEFSGGKCHWHETVQVPFVIPDSLGTYQFTISNCSIFTNKKD
jgi:SAM-dependent methyltransferase